MSNTNQYRVGSRAGICIGPRYLGPNVVIPNEILTDPIRERLLKERAIVRIGEVEVTTKPAAPPAVGVSEREFWDKNKTTDASVGDPTSTNAGVKARAALAQLAVDREEGRIAPREPVTSVEMVRETPAPAAPSDARVWTHDPDGLVSLPIEDLRKLVLDVDNTMEVNHLDEVELIAVLSSEYVAPSQSQVAQS